MKEIHFESGVVLSYDDTLVVGDYITTYYEGIHKITSIQLRKDGISGGIPLLSFVKVADKNYFPIKGKAINLCCASYCRKVTIEFIEKQQDIELKKLQEKLGLMSNFMRDHL